MHHLNLNGLDGVIPQTKCDILAQGLIELIEYSYQQGTSSFLEVIVA